MRMWHRASGLLFLTVAVSCSSAPPSPSPEIPVQGEKDALKAMAGRWEGTYINPVNGRKGSIVFDVTSNGKEAYGDILMVPPGANAPAQPSKKATPSETLKTMPKVLQINFFQASGNQVTGTVGPYEDMDCSCDAQSSFQGTLAGDSIEGTFRTDYFDANGDPLKGKASTTGSWKVHRVPKK